MVGDYVLDVQAGRAAGRADRLLDQRRRRRAGRRRMRTSPAARTTPPATSWCTASPSWTTSSGSACPCPAASCPTSCSPGTSRGLAPRDPAVLVPAGIGEDVTALDIADADIARGARRPDHVDERATSARYAVLVNANDIAASGGVPRWLLTTVLLPAGTTRVGRRSRCWPTSPRRPRAAGVALVGGHTEVSDAVTRPVVAATMLGTMRRADLRDKREVRPGDRVILTKALAVEGTALLAAGTRRAPPCPRHGRRASSMRAAGCWTS